MPRIGDNEGMNSHNIGGTGFSFTGVGLGRLNSTEYTVVGAAVDITGSTSGFENELRDMLIAVAAACKKSPRSDNLIMRATTFSTSVGPDNELHGFKPLSDIDPLTYPQFVSSGATPLYDAAFASIGAVVNYGADLMKNDFLANGIVFIITDGGNTSSIQTPATIKKLIEDTKKKERLESLVTILIGVNAGAYATELAEFQKDAGIDQYVDVGNVTPGKLAKLAAFISQSVSSQSAAVGTGGPSQNISATI